MEHCYICRQPNVQALLNFGPQPVSNRFLVAPTQHEFMHPLTFGYCENCGLAQLLNAVSSGEVKPAFDWIRYNEPEGHLDQVAEILVSLPNINAQASFCGISGKEGSLLNRLHKKGFTKTWELDIQQDLGVNLLNAGIETIQLALNPNQAKKIVQEKNKTKVILARHILEHTHNPLLFMSALKELVADDGYIVFEVPDCTKLLETYEYSAIWEEHTLYFTPRTFLQALEQGGFALHSFNIYPYAMENCMVAIVQVKNTQTSTSMMPSVSSLSEEKARLQAFAKQFPIQREWYLKTLTAFKEKGLVSLLGAGHLATHFINLFNLEHLIDFIVDDHPQKKGLYMPGSQLPIYPSSALEEKAVKMCLLSLNQESEQKVVQNKQGFLSGGGQFYSIFSTSPLALQGA